VNVAKFSVERPVAVTMRIAGLVLLGAVCLTKIPIDLLPNVSIPTLNVSTQWPNVAPEEMETQITRPIEQAVSSANNIYSINSQSTQGQSRVTIQFNWGTDINAAVVDVLQLVQRARNSFPDDPTLSQPQVFKYDPSSLPIIIYAVTGIDDPVQLRTILDNDVSPLLTSADGVAAVTDTGGLQRSIVVNVDADKSKAYGIPLSTIEARLVQENISLPAGIAKQGNTEYTIRAVGYFNTPKEMESMPIGSYNGQVVTLGMVSKVVDYAQEQRISTRLNGKPAVGVSITKQSGANTVTTADAIKERLKTVLKEYPMLKFNLAYEQAGFVQNSINDLKNTAIIGGGLAIIILMMFLRNVRSTMVVALSIPISIVSTFALFYFMGFTLNTISLSGLALSTGLIVDDAVVVLENIFRHIERDKRRAAEAAVTGTQEIISAVVASTLTIMVVFLPLLLIQGQAGEMFAQFAYVVIFSIAISLLDATTVVPMLASRLINEEEVEEESHPELRAQRGKKTGPLTRVFDYFGRQFDALDNSYHRGLKWALGHRLLVVGAATVVTALSFLLVPLVGSEMLPQTDSGNYSVNLKLPVGSAYATTDAAVKKMETALLADPDTQTVFSAAGTSLGFRGAGSSQIAYQGAATVTLKDNRKHSTQDAVVAMQKSLGKIPGARALITPYDLVTQILTGGATNMEVDVFGQDYTQITAKANEVLAAMRQVPGLESVDLGVQESTPELHWNVDRAKAAQLGIAFSDVAGELQAATTGVLSSYYQENGYQYPIYVQMPIGSEKTVDELKALPITASLNKNAVQSGSGSSSNSSSSSMASKSPAPVLLGQVASPQFVLGPNEIDRLNRQRYIAVTGRVQGRSASEVQDDVQKVMNGIQFDTGTFWDFGLNQKRQGQEFAGLGLAVFLAISLIYMLLASQFESFIYPLIVLTSVPLCALGVIVAMFISGRAFGLTAFIGVLMLIGIVVKNGILLVDYTNTLRGRGMNRDEAILTASPTRLRPILMTSSAAILGMMPLALGIGKGSETQAPLATAVVGGLSTSTLMTLFIVPIVYTFFDDIARRFRKDDRDLAPVSTVGPSVNAVERKVDAGDPAPSPQTAEVDGRG
jgi:HAE1 family hydrophobic/amphiphilic exporter-1